MRFGPTARCFEAHEAAVRGPHILKAASIQAVRFVGHAWRLNGIIEPRDKKSIAPKKRQRVYARRLNVDCESKSSEGVNARLEPKLIASRRMRQR